MAYCTQDQLIERFGAATLIAATDREAEPTGTIDAAAVTRAIADTDAVIDGYVGVRYALPLSETPTIVVDLALTIAVYKLHAAVAGEKITADYRDAIKQLRDIADGKIKLGVAGIESASSGGETVVTNEPERPFDNSTMKSWI